MVSKHSDANFGCADSCNTASNTASVQIVHNSASPTVDVYVDGALAVPDSNTELQLVC